MGRRGPKPHPDILTPRQWEVLALIREGLQDQQIADRLGISLDGAKYHVSEILSKLGVATREAAAAWRVEERGHPTATSLSLKIALTSTALVLVAGLGLLGARWLIGEASEERVPTVSRDEALVLAGTVIGWHPVYSPEADYVSVAEVADQLESVEFETSSDTNHVWLVTMGTITNSSVNFADYDELGVFPCEQIRVVVPDETKPIPTLVPNYATQGQCPFDSDWREEMLVYSTRVFGFASGATAPAVQLVERITWEEAAERYGDTVYERRRTEGVNPSYDYLYQISMVGYFASDRKLYTSPPEAPFETSCQEVVLVMGVADIAFEHTEASADCR